MCIRDRFKAREDAEHLRGQLKGYVEEANRAKNEASELKREIFRLQTQLDVYKRQVSIPYWISRLSGAQALERLVEKHPKAQAIRSFRLGGDFFFAFLSRIVGLFSCDLISMYMGAVKLPYLPYLLGSVCGFFPHVAAYAFMGDAIADPTSAQFRLAVAVLAGLILLSSGACLLFQHHHPDKTA